MYCTSKITPKSPELDFDLDFDLASFGLHICLVFNLWGWSFTTLYLLIMKDHLFWIRTLYQHNFPYFTGPGFKVFVRIFFVFSSCYIILIESTFYYFVIYNCFTVTICSNGILTCWSWDWTLPLSQVVIHLL